tara:strand:- start:38 stop:760 length:723 start_codon:yes stop_codon:yes gene_type:complete
MTDLVIYDSAKLDIMLEDIITKYPAGVNSQMERSDYVMDGAWLTSANIYRDTPVVSNDSPHREKYPFWGYSASDIMQMEWHAEQTAGSLRSYLSNRDPDASTKAISRRHNLLHHRMRAGVAEFQRREGPGIYKVTVNYSDPIYVIASSKKSAKMIGGTMLLGTVTREGDPYFRADRVNVASAKTCSWYNETALQSRHQELKNSLSKIKRLQEKCQELNLMINSLNEFGQAQVEMLKEGNV